MATRKPIPIPRLTQETENKLLDRVVRSASGCWEWSGCRGTRGYGRMSVAGRVLRVHRIAYAMSCGPIPDGLEVCHNCPGGDNPACCNPTHLFLGTQADNMRDAYLKGTCRPVSQVGEKNPNTKLTADEVRFIRAVADAGRRLNVAGWRVMLADRFGISEKGVFRIVRGEVWGHVQ